METLRDSNFRSIAHQLEQLITVDRGFISIDQIRDETYVVGNDSGLLAVAAAIIWQFTGDKGPTKNAESRLARMAIDGNYIGIWRVDTEIQYRQMRPAGLATLWVLLILGVILLLSALGLVTFVNWLF